MHVRVYVVCVSVIMYVCELFPGGSDGRASACNARDPGSIPGLGRSPGGGNGNPLQYSCLENFQGLRSLVGYSPWGHKGLDTTEQLHFTYICLYTCDFGPNTTNGRSKRC